MNCEIPDEPRVEGACGWAMCVFLFLLRSVANTARNWIRLSRYKSRTLGKRRKMLTNFFSLRVHSPIYQGLWQQFCGWWPFPGSIA